MDCRTIQLPKGVMPLIIHIPKPTTYLIPEGSYAGRCKEVGEISKATNAGPVRQIRFWFELNIPSITSATPLAGCSLDLDLNPGSKLLRFLDVWLGGSFVNGGSFDLSSLKNQPVEVLVEHLHNDSHKQPFVLVKAVYRPGHLKLTENPTHYREAA